MFHLFNRQSRQPSYKTPTGRYYDLFRDMADRPHLLIAGATGSGKSVLINGIMTALLYQSPARARFILIDPKRLELVKYKNLPHTILHAGPDDMAHALQEAIRLMDERFQSMEKRGLTMYDGPDLYVVVDELADLLLTDHKTFLPLIQRLSQLGRAARVHCIAATQNPTADVIPAPIRVNFDSKVGLRTASRQDSRNILQMPGCELLPDPSEEHRAQGYYKRGCRIDLYDIPMYPAAERNRLIEYWSNPKNYLA